MSEERCRRKRLFAAEQNVSWSCIVIHAIQFGWGLYLDVVWLELPGRMAGPAALRRRQPRLLTAKFDCVVHGNKYCNLFVAAMIDAALLLSQSYDV